MANLGSTTYTSVVWTAGDILTEAKLDNMVANDQAYDSHTSQGLQLDNGKAYCSKDSGGTARDLMRLSSSNILELSAWDGWLYLPTANVPAYSSATVITNPSGIDWTAYINIGDMVSFVQTTTKYFYVTGVTSTNLTLNGGTDYTVANAAITVFKYTKVPHDAVGSPVWFTYTATVNGSGGTIGTYAETILSTPKFMMVGKSVFVKLTKDITNKGSWSGDIQVAVPITIGDLSYLSGTISNHGDAINSLKGDTMVAGGGTAFVNFLKTVATAVTQWADITANVRLQINGFYHLT